MILMSMLLLMPMLLMMWMLTLTMYHQHSGNVTAVLGKSAILNCRVEAVGNRTVGDRLYFEDYNEVDLDFSWMTWKKIISIFVFLGFMDPAQGHSSTHCRKVPFPIILMMSNFPFHYSILLGIVILITFLLFSVNSTFQYQNLVWFILKAISFLNKNP